MTKYEIRVRNGHGTDIHYRTYDDPGLAEREASSLNGVSDHDHYVESLTDAEEATRRKRVAEALENPAD